MRDRTLWHGQIPDHVEHPGAYHNAVNREIAWRAKQKRTRLWKEANPELAAVLEDCWSPDYDLDGELELRVLTLEQRRTIARRIAWLHDGWEKYGSLTDKQTEKLAQIVAEVKAGIEEREEAERLRREAASEWIEGRYEVEATILWMGTVDAPRFSYHDSGQKVVIKAQLDDGRQFRCTAPAPIKRWDDEGQREARGKRILLTATWKASDKDATFAFGNRPHMKKGA